jgi:hypothetical protein
MLLTIASEERLVIPRLAQRAEGPLMRYELTQSRLRKVSAE